MARSKMPVKSDPSAPTASELDETLRRVQVVEGLVDSPLIAVSKVSVYRAHQTLIAKIAGVLGVSQQVAMCRYYEHMLEDYRHILNVVIQKLQPENPKIT